MGAGDTEGAKSPEQPAIDDTLRALLRELDEYLATAPEEQLSENVLPLASARVVKAAGFDIERYTREAKQFVDATPEHDRVLGSFPDAVAYYLGLRLTMTEDDEIEPVVAEERLAHARAALEERARLVEDDFPHVAKGFRCLLEETAETYPPEDRLWRAMALRIGEPAMPRPGWSS